MTGTLKKTDIIRNADGSIYHINLQPHHIKDIVITVGDPDRVGMVSQYFDEVYDKVSKREFVSHTGRYGDKEITVISTGIGVDNIEIVLTEIDTLVNIDLEKLERKKQQRSLQFIRIGTSGAIQPDIPVGAMIASGLGVGLDNLIRFYSFEMDAGEEQLCNRIRSSTLMPVEPYVAKGSATLLQNFGSQMTIGGTVTAPGFYAPQGRELRVPLTHGQLLDGLSKFKDDNFRLTNFEMETAFLYALGGLMGHKMISLNAILANRVTGEFADDSKKLVDNLIRTTLDLI